jgi:hypothetical protein
LLNRGIAKIARKTDYSQTAINAISAGGAFLSLAGRMAVAVLKTSVKDAVNTLKRRAAPEFTRNR